MERFPTHHTEAAPTPDPKALADRIGSLLNGDYTLELVDDTYEIDSDDLQFSFVVEDDIFEIRNIEVNEKGLGTKVLSQVHQFADKHKMSVLASNVKDGAEGFWQRMGYEEGTTAGEFIKNS